MRLHITLEDHLVRELDRRIGRRRRSAFIGRAVEHALDDARRSELIESALGPIADDTHEWDPEPAGWVRGQRGFDKQRVG